MSYVALLMGEVGKSINKLKEKFPEILDSYYLEYPERLPVRVTNDSLYHEFILRCERLAEVP